MPEETGTVTIMYSTAGHTVVVELPGSLPPMEASPGREFRPERVTLSYSVHSSAHPGEWRSRVEVNGPWLAEEGKTRTGTACLLPWQNFPGWLTALIEEHRPGWMPELPEAIIPDGHPAKRS